jgi:uncharacterized protein YkwD
MPAPLNGAGERLLQLCNDARCAAGAPPLAWHPLLARVAQQHAQDMALHAYFSHVDRQGRGVGERLMAAGYVYRWAGENISGGHAGIDQVFTGWMGSAEHRANILHAEYAQMGLGYHFVEPDSRHLGHYWVQVFGTLLPS